MRREHLAIVAPQVRGREPAESGYRGFLRARLKAKSATHLRIGAADAVGVRLPHGRPLIEA